MASHCRWSRGGDSNGAVPSPHIKRQLRGQPLEPFRYRNQGTLATIGRNAAVANVFGVQAERFYRVGDVARDSHIQLIGFRNKLFVLINWAWIISSTSAPRG